jgi:hypothetical protein
MTACQASTRSICQGCARFISSEIRPVYTPPTPPPPKMPHSGERFRPGGQGKTCRIRTLLDRIEESPVDRMVNRHPLETTVFDTNLGLFDHFERVSCPEMRLVSGFPVRTVSNGEPLTAIAKPGMLYPEGARRQVDAANGKRRLCMRPIRANKFSFHSGHADPESFHGCAISSRTKSGTLHP